MGLFSRKKEVTATVKNELNSLIARWGKNIDKLNTTDDVKTYISALEDALKTANKLEDLENTYDWKHGKYKWDGGIQKALVNMDNKKSQNEKAFIDRAYEKMNRDCLKLSTETGKANKAKQFFAELEYYYKYFNEDTISYIESKK